VVGFGLILFFYLYCCGISDFSRVSCLHVPFVVGYFASHAVTVGADFLGVHLVVVSVRLVFRH